ncbi:MAG: GMC oxidoreductase, partial [Rhodanobacter sp.]
MSLDFDIIIVGSGPAGVSIAFPLLGSGLRILMVDGGAQPDVTLPARNFLTERFEQADQWKWMIGEQYHALTQRDAVSPKLRAPTQSYVFAGANEENRIVAHDFVAIGSLASGGLSNGWGCGVAAWTAEELSAFPFPASELTPSYRAVSERIGISGRQDDDLADYFGLDAWAQPAIPLDNLHRRLERNYLRRRDRCSELGFRLGRSRVAVLNTAHAGRLPCDRLSNCLYGCSRRSLYSSRHELPALQNHGNFQYEAGFIVEQLVRQGDSWEVQGHVAGDASKGRTITARRVVLAAGTLATTRLALRTLQWEGNVPVASSPTAAFLLWLPRLLGAQREPSFGLGQLSFSLTLKQGFTAFGSTFSTTGLPVAEFASRMPMNKRSSISLLGNLLSSCVVGNAFLPGTLSATVAQLDAQGALHVHGKQDERVPALMAETARRLRKAYGRLGAMMLPTSFTMGKPGADIHYAASLPMRGRPEPTQTNAEGELEGLPGVYVADGASLPTLTEKSHTLTIMANADRMGRRLAAK